MDPSEELDPAESEFIKSLKRLSPAAAAAVDPVAAAFAAGGRRARRRMRIWQGATVLAVAVGGASWMNFGNRAGPAAGPSTVMAEKSAEPAGSPLPDESIVKLQAAVLEHGLDGLPASPHGAVKVLHIEDLL